MIFAVTAEQIGVYDRLKNHIEGSTAGILSENSENVVDLVKDQYSVSNVFHFINIVKMLLYFFNLIYLIIILQKISSSIEMKDTASSDIKVTYYSKCLDTDGELKQTNKCDGLKVGTLVNFEAKIEVTACPKNRKDWKQEFKIYPVGIDESLIINLEMQCDCLCENPNEPVRIYFVMVTVVE